MSGQTKTPEKNIEAPENDKPTTENELPVTRRPCLIEDGYTISGAIYKINENDQVGRPVETLEYDFEFQYRPLNRKERLEWGEKVSQKDSTEEEFQLIASRVKEWNLYKKNGEMLPVTPANCSRLDPELTDYLLGIILGMPGVENQAHPEIKSNVGYAQEDEDAKNS